MKTTILPLAIALAFSFTAVPADAALSNADKCEVFRAKTEMNFAKCLKVANLLEAKGKTGDRAKCVTKFDQGIAKAKTKFVNDKLNVTEAECSLNQEAVDAIKALDLVAAGVALADYGLDSGDLPLYQDIQDLIDDAVDAVDITSDNAALCTDAGGTYDAGTDTCTPGYNCTIGAMCSACAAKHPEAMGCSPNNYVGHTAATSGCVEFDWEANVSFVSNISPTGIPINGALYFLTCE
ncbi:MAG: hypothetical protein P8K07_10290 [Candidatus Binatia bacterium]|nr:hypothetical protein [Candidatus Binatia bacterium]